MRVARRFWLGGVVLGVMGAAGGQTAMTPMAEHAHKVKVASTLLTVRVGAQTATLTLADLQAMPQRTLMVHNGHSNVDESYTGVGVSDLLAKYGFTMSDGGGTRKIYHSYVRAEGTDKYYVVFSVGELEPMLHTGDAIVALTVDGKALTEDGKFKMVVGGEKRPARWVTNLSALSVVEVE